MAPITRRPRGRPRKQPQEQPQEESILDYMARQSGQEPEQPKNEPTLADLQAQLATLNKRVEETDKANLALIAAAPVVRPEVKEPSFSTEGLPDPIVDPKGFALEMAKRQQQYMADLNNYTQAQRQPVQSVAGNADALWNEFTEQFADYAQDEEGLEFVITKVMKKAATKGIDLDKYRFQNSDRFFRDITEAYDNLFGKPTGETADEPAPRRQAARAEPEPDEDAGRTAGIFGGVDASNGRAPRRGAEENPYAATGMLKDIQDIQRKSGYY